MASGGTKVVLQAIGGNSFITVIKFIGYFLTQSPSMMAEAIHSLADTANQVLLLVGMKHAKRKPSKQFSHGLGSASYVWNLISAVSVFFVGFGITFYHGMHSLLSGHYEVSAISYLAIGILLVSLVIEGWILRGAILEVNKQRGKSSFLEFFSSSDDPTILAVLLEDAVAVLGVSLALAGVIIGQLLQSAIFDIAVSLIISFLLAFLAISLGIINGKLLIGRRVTPELENEIKEFIESQVIVNKIIHLSSKILGQSQVRLSLEIGLHGEYVIDRAALEDDASKIKAGESAHKVLMKSNERMIRLTGEAINKLELAIQERFPEVKIIDLEID